MEKANQALSFLASGQIPQNSKSYSASRRKEIKKSNHFRNQSIIGLLLLVFLGIIVF